MLNPTGRMTPPIKHGSQSYLTPGTYSFVVPYRITSVQFALKGAGGGGGGQDSAGNAVNGQAGDYVLTNISVIPGESLTIIVGAKGLGGGQFFESGSSGGNGYTPGESGTSGDYESEEIFAWGGAGGGGSTGVKRDTTRLGEAKGGNGGKSSDFDSFIGGDGGAGGGTNYPALTTQFGGGAGGSKGASPIGIGSSGSDGSAVLIW